MVVYILCQNENLIIKLKPPIADIRIFYIDRACIRGIIPLKFLSLFQDFIGIACLIQDLFDLVIGSNSDKKLHVFICQTHRH